jgi:hypothetical protein
MIDDAIREFDASRLTATLRGYPADDPLRDSGQVKLLNRLRPRVAATVAWHIERGLQGWRDARAWDLVLDGHGCTDGIEAVTRFGDAQAIQRRAMRKFRDDRSIQHLFLVIAGTHANRAALAATRESMRTDLPLDTRAILQAWSEGRCPGAGGIVIL